MILPSLKLSWLNARQIAEITFSTTISPLHFLLLASFPLAWMGLFHEQLALADLIITVDLHRMPLTAII